MNSIQGKTSSGTFSYISASHLQFVVIIVFFFSLFNSWIGPVLSKEQLIPLFSEALVLIYPRALLKFLLYATNVSISVVFAVWNSVWNSVTVSVDFLHWRKTTPQP